MTVPGDIIIHTQRRQRKIGQIVFTMFVFHGNESPNSLTIHCADGCQTFWNKAMTLQHRSHLPMPKKCQTIFQFVFFIYFFLPRNMNSGIKLVLKREIFDSLQV